MSSESVSGESLPVEPMPGEAAPPVRSDFAADARLVLTALARMEAAIHGERAARHRLQDGLSEMANAIASAKAATRPTEPDATSAGSAIAALLDELEHRVDAMMEIAAGGHPVSEVAADAAATAQPEVQAADDGGVPTVSGVVSRLGRGHEAADPEDGAPEDAHTNGDAGPTVEMLQAMVEALGAFAPETEAADAGEPAEPAIETEPETLAVAAAVTAAPVDLDMALAQAVSLQGDAVFQESDLLSSFARMEAIPHLPPEVGTAVVFAARTEPAADTAPETDIAPEPEQRAAPEPEPGPADPAPEPPEPAADGVAKTATTEVMAIAALIRAAAATAAAARESRLIAVGGGAPDIEPAAEQVAVVESAAQVEPAVQIELVAFEAPVIGLAQEPELEPEPEPEPEASELVATEVVTEFESAEATIEAEPNTEPAMDVAAIEDAAPVQPPEALQTKPTALPDNIYAAEFDPSAFLFGADSEPEPDDSGNKAEAVEEAELPPADMPAEIARPAETPEANGDPIAAAPARPIPEPAPHDPLAPLKAMTADERIALFS